MVSPARGVLGYNLKAGDLGIDIGTGMSSRNKLIKQMRRRRCCRSTSLWEGISDRGRRTRRSCHLTKSEIGGM